MRVLNGTATALGPCPSRPRYAPTGGIDGDKPAHGLMIEQDRDIAEKSGQPPAKIKSITRSGRRRRTGMLRRTAAKMQHFGLFFWRSSLR
jgi:hypothetical protein